MYIFVTCLDLVVFIIVSRTLVRPDISSNWQKVKLMSGGTKILQLFWQFLKAVMGALEPQILQNYSLETLLQINITNILHKFENFDFAGVFFPFKLTACVI